MSSRTYGFETLRAQLSAIAQQASEEGDLIDLPRSTGRSGLFDRAYEHAKSELYTPAVEALDQTYAIIGDRCDYQDINIDDISKVFGQTQVGRELRNLSRIHTRDVVSVNEGKTFRDACINIVGCYHQEELKLREIERDDFTVFTTQTKQSCTSIVTSLYNATYQVSASHQTIKSKNYGESIFLNGIKEDGPFDLMLDVEEIAKHLFRENTSVTPIEVYNLPDGVWNSEVERDDEIAEDGEEELIDPNDLDRQERYTPTQGVPPVLPDESPGVYPYPNTPPESDPEPDLPPGICLDEAPYQGEADEPTYEDEVEQQEQTQEGLDDLSLTELELSILIAQRYTREQEEALGDDDSENDPELPDTEGGIEEYEEDLEGTTLEQVKEHVQGCVEQFTNGNKDNWRKTLWNSITQPTEFTQCVFQGLCKEVGDPSGLGMYNIKICKEPKKGGSVIGSAGVKSVEEIIDTMNTTCRSLQESGQLLKHNKTKDHREHRLMNIQLDDVFSFGLSVVFDEPETVRDFAREQRQQIQNNAILEKRLLGITDKMTSLKQRNKYMIINDTLEDTSIQGFNDVASEEQRAAERLDVTLEDFADAQGLARNAQQLGKVQTAEFLSVFIEDNISFWRAANDYTSSLQTTWKSGYEEFSGKK